MLKWRYITYSTVLYRWYRSNTRQRCTVTVYGTGIIVLCKTGSWNVNVESSNRARLEAAREKEEEEEKRRCGTGGKGTWRAARL